MSEGPLVVSAAVAARIEAAQARRGSAACRRAPGALSLAVMVRESPHPTDG